MKIGIIGAGEVAVAIARYALAAGHEVVLSNSGNMDKLAGVVAQLGAGAFAGTVSEAASEELVVFAVPWTQVRRVLGELPHWEGRTLIDATNPFLQIEPEWIFEDLGDDSASEVVARLAVGAQVVKAFNSLLMCNFQKDPCVGETRRLLWVSGDYPEAKRKVVDLIESFGFAVVDLGGLRVGGRLQQAGSVLAGPDFLVSSEADS
jgi:predicted dinucleotide-binding enzyme